MVIWRRYGGVVVAVGALAIFLYLFADTQSWSTRARLFAQVIVGPAVLLAAVQVVREGGRARAAVLMPGPPDAAVTGAAAAWMAAFFGAVLVVGMIVTIPVFTVTYLRVEAKLSWLAAVVYAAVAVAFVWFVFGSLLHIPFPKGVIGFSPPGLS